MELDLGTISYGVAALAFLLLTTMLATIWRERIEGARLAIACLTCTAWAGAAAFIPGQTDATLDAVYVLEIARNATWFAFLIGLFGHSGNNVAALRKIAVATVTFGAIALAAKLFFGADASAQMITVVLLSQLLMAVVGIFLIEHLYRSLASENRWATKFLCVGLGSMFVYDFFLYSDALLLRHMTTDIWAARGIVNAMVASLIAVAVARNPKWSIDVAVSHRLLFHATAIFGAAVYLLVMAAAGYYIRYFGGSWGPVLQVTFLFGALLLATILLSGTLRARVKVFLGKNFFRYHYDYREEWLRFTRALSQGEPGTQVIYAQSSRSPNWLKAWAERCGFPGMEGSSSRSPPGTCHRLMRASRAIAICASFSKSANGSSACPSTIQNRRYTMD